MSFNPDALNAEMARRDLIAFAKRMMPQWQPAKHLIYIAELLQKLERGELRGAVVSLPVRHGKSVLASQLFSAWHLGRHPEQNIILASYSDALATSHARITKHLIEHDRYPFQGVKIAADSSSVQRFNVTQGGSMRALGTGAGISGYGADLLILDDALHDGLSQSEKDQAWTWWQDVCVPRLNPGAKTLIIGARHSTDDLIGRILDSDSASEYHYVAIPAIAEANDVLGRAQGEALWPERISVDELESRRRNMSESAFVAQFQQRPELSTYGQIFRAEWFPRYDALPVPNVRPYNPLDKFVNSALSAAYVQPDDFVRVTALDAAGKLTESGSFSALCTLLSDGHDAYVCEVQRARVDYDGLRKMVVEHVDRWKSDVLLVENEGMGSRIIGSLEAGALPITALDPVKGKVERAASVAHLCEQGRVWLPERFTSWRESFERELFAFPSSRFNDMVDAFTWSLWWAFRIQHARREAAAFDRQVAGFSLFAG